MLISPNALGALLLLNGVPSLAGAPPDAAATSGNFFYRPQDPSTLTLALIGAATLAAFLAWSRALRTRRPARIITEVSDFEIAADLPAPPVITDVEEPSRGAA